MARMASKSASNTKNFRGMSVSGQISAKVWGLGTPSPGFGRLRAVRASKVGFRLSTMRSMVSAQCMYVQNVVNADWSQILASRGLRQIQIDYIESRVLIW